MVLWFLAVFRFSGGRTKSGLDLMRGSVPGSLA